MAVEKPSVCVRTHHIRILYFTCALLFVFSISCFVVTFLFFAQLRDDLSQKCSCPDGEMLFAITVLPPSSDDSTTSPRPDRAAPASGATGGVRADLGLTASRDQRNRHDDLRGLSRVRRGTQGKDFDYKGTSFEAYARLPITISVDSVIAFCNSTASQCPAGPPGPKGADGRAGKAGKDGAPGPVGPTGKPSAAVDTPREDGKNCSCIDADLESQIAILLARTTQLIGQSGEPGPVGPKGPPGEKGDFGDTGPKGPSGSKGNTGDSGPAGLQGVQGPAGKKGLTGVQGLQGLKGDKGEIGPPGDHGRHGNRGDKGDAGVDGQKGATGSPGVKGDTGDVGAPGENGTKGRSGEDGKNCTCVQPGNDDKRTEIPTNDAEKQQVGLPGPPGAPGPKGQDGEIGPKGDVGLQGPAGTNGTSGVKGKRGSIGVPGVKGDMGEACNITALIQEIIQADNKTLQLLQGSTGPRGSLGPTGPEGRPGTDGKPGTPGEKGETGSNSPPGLMGPQGEKGTPGAKGLAGSFGYPGEKGSNGQEGPPGSEGSSGKPGIDGFPGGQGEKGQKGERGGDGLQGLSGLHGEPGVDGIQGPPGEKGDKGDNGKFGPQGPPGVTGAMGPSGEKGDKGDQGIASGMVELGNDGEREKQEKVTEPPSVEEPKSPPPIKKTPNSECVLKSIGPPENQHVLSTFWGSWMQDTAPNPPYPDMIWVTKHLSGDLVYEYADIAALKDSTYNYYRISYLWAGTGHVVYNNALYFHTGGSAEILRYDFATETVTARGSIPNAVFMPTIRTGYLYDSDYTFLDLAIDDNGLWVIYKTAEYNENLVVAALDLDDLSIVETIISKHPQRSSGDAFIMCGILYTTKSSKNRHSTVDFAVNLFTGEVLPDVDIPYENGRSKLTMMSFNHRTQLLYAWDKGNMVTYSINVI